MAGENFFHADYEATLLSTYGKEYEDTLVVEGGVTTAGSAAGTVAGTTGNTLDIERGNGETIKIAASATPHSEILEKAEPILEQYGYKLDVVVFEDYVQPNLVVESGEFDANYFQHVPYLDSFNAEQGTHLVNAGGIHYEPFGIYPGTKKSLSDIADGDSIAVPNDTTNEARALLLLQDNGLLKLKDGVIARMDNAKLYDELIQDDDVLINGEEEYGADCSAEFIDKGGLILWLDSF